MIQPEIGICVWTDDNEAKLIVCRAGHIDALQPQPPAPSMICMWQDKESFWAATNDYGYENPEDCGYTVIAFSKSQFTREQAARKILEIMRDGMVIPTTPPKAGNN